MHLGPRRASDLSAVSDCAATLELLCPARLPPRIGGVLYAVDEQVRQRETVDWIESQGGVGQGMESRLIDRSSR